MKHNLLKTQQLELEAATTHFLGFLLSVIATYILSNEMLSNTDPLLKAGCSLYLGTLMLVYITSTMSHMYTFQSINIFLRSCDQGFIYLLIVGTATPFISLLLSSDYTTTASIGFCMLILLWGLAFIGCISKIVFTHRLYNVAISLYILLGWGEAAVLLLVQSQINQQCLHWLIIGGLCYSIGTIFLVLDWNKYHFHTIWHLFVIAGSISHFYSILLLVYNSTQEHAI